MNRIPGAVKNIHRLVLRAYPPEYLETFGDEMQNTFMYGLEEASEQGEIASFILREIRDAPRSLVNAYWYGWSRKIMKGIELFQHVTSSADLPPAQPDGRDSWGQAFLEMSTFLVAGLLLILATYLPFDGLRPGWQRDFQFLGSIILPTTIPLLLFGLAHGLPRWSYPLAGLLFCDYGFFTGQTGLWLFLTIMLLATSVLFLAAILTDPHPSLLPAPLRRIGQSISLDWTRLSFGIYGAMPLIILKAFDDAHTDSLTPYFAFSVLAMVACALLYSRSRDATLQITLLIAGLTFSVWGAWMDKVSFVGGLMNWVVVSSTGLASFAWLVILWLQWTAFILFSSVFILFNKLVHLKRAI